MNLWSEYAVKYVFGKFEKAYPKQNYTEKFFWDQALCMELVVAENVREKFQEVNSDSESEGN